MAKKKFTVVSLFTGAMGLDIGIDKTGNFELLACVEKESIFCSTIQENINLANISSSPRIYNIDIKKLKAETVLSDLGLKPGELDLLIGGPPCQAFSTAGKRGSLQDVRGTLIWDFLKFVEVLQPKIFLMENVRGLLSAAIKHRRIADRPDKGGPRLLPEEQPGSVVALFVEDLKNFKTAPYHVDYFEVNSVNYGAPQIRERVIFIGNRYNEDIMFPAPTHVNPFSVNNSDLIPWKSLKDAIGDLPEPTKDMIMDFSPRKKKFLSKIPQGGNWRHLSEDLQRESMGGAFFAKGGRSGWWRRLSWDLPSPTLVTMPNHSSTSLCHPEELRALSIKEYCRIQEFPDDWVVCGSIQEQYTQIGNAVPTRLGYISGVIIAAALNDIYDGNKKPLVNKDQIKEMRGIYLQSHIRTRSWYKNGKPLVWGSKEATYTLPKTIRKEQLLESKN